MKTPKKVDSLDGPDYSTANSKSKLPKYIGQWKPDTMAVDAMAVDAMAVDAMAVDAMAAISQKVDTMAAVSYHMINTYLYVHSIY